MKNPMAAFVSPAQMFPPNELTATTFRPSSETSPKFPRGYARRGCRRTAPRPVPARKCSRRAPGSCIRRTSRQRRASVEPRPSRPPRVRSAQGSSHLPQTLIKSESSVLRRPRHCTELRWPWRWRATKPSGEESRVVAAAQRAAAECAGWSPPTEPLRGSRRRSLRWAGEGRSELKDAANRADHSCGKQQRAAPDGDKRLRALYLAAVGFLDNVE